MSYRYGIVNLGVYYLPPECHEVKFPKERKADPYEKHVTYFPETATVEDGEGPIVEFTYEGSVGPADDVPQNWIDTELEATSWKWFLDSCEETLWEICRPIVERARKEDPEFYKKNSIYLTVPVLWEQDIWVNQGYEYSDVEATCFPLCDASDLFGLMATEHERREKEKSAGEAGA